MGKKIYSGDENKRKLLEGVNELADTVKLTMGAAGLNVIIQALFNQPLSFFIRAAIINNQNHFSWDHGEPKTVKTLP